jgi:hypothetical protein
MPYTDLEQRREYDKRYKQRQRAEGWTKKRFDKCLTPATEITEGVCDLFNEIVTETQNADDASLKLEAKLRIKLRAVEIGLRLIETTNHEQRIAALVPRSLSTLLVALCGGRQQRSCRGTVSCRLCQSEDGVLAQRGALVLIGIT